MNKKELKEQLLKEYSSKANKEFDLSKKISLSENDPILQIIKRIKQKMEEY